MSRRRLVTGVAAALVAAGVAPGIGARAVAAAAPADTSGWHDVRRFGAKSDGVANDSVRGAAIMPSTIAGVVGAIEIADVQLDQLGGQSQTLLHYFPAAAEDAYPEPGMFGALPATGPWTRDVRNLALRNIEVATTYADRRPALWFERAGGVTITDLRSPAPAVGLRKVTGFRRKDADAARDVAIAAAEERML